MRGPFGLAGGIRPQAPPTLPSGSTQIVLPDVLAVSGQVTAGQGAAATPAGAWPVSVADGSDTTIGAQADAAAATDTATSSYVGLFKRLLQRTTTLIGQLPSTLGITTKANSLSVAVASDQTVPVSGTFFQTTQPVSLLAHQSINLDQWNGIAPTAAAVLSDGAANPTAPLIGACELLWNGSTWDRQTGTQSGTLLVNAARTATTSSADQTNRNSSGVIVALNISAIAGGSGTLSIYIRDPISGLAINLVTTAAISGVGTYGLVLYPGVAGTPPAAMTFASIPLPRVWGITVTGNGSSMTYSVSYQLVP